MRNCYYSHFTWAGFFATVRVNEWKCADYMDPFLRLCPCKYLEKNSWLRWRENGGAVPNERQQKMLSEVEALNREFSFEPTLLGLLK